MTPAFELGALDAMEKMAKMDTHARAMLIRQVFKPEAWGAISGAAMGAVVAPEDQRKEYALYGAGIGALMGHGSRYTNKKTLKKVHESVGGPATSAAVGAMHGVF